MLPNTFYHLFNRGINRQLIYFKRDNYLFFIEKIRKHLLSQLDLIAYCLMPNHFHLLAYTKSEIIPKEFSKNLRIMLSSYARAINNQEKRVGSLFQQHTKIKQLEEFDPIIVTNMNTSQDEYPITCFNYIHHNPLKAHLVQKIQDWEMSSFREYAGFRKNTLCTMSLAYEKLNIPASPALFLKYYNQDQG
jgi:putative transposase